MWLNQKRCRLFIKIMRASGSKTKGGVIVEATHCEIGGRLFVLIGELEGGEDLDCDLFVFLVFGWLTSMGLGNAI